MYSKAMVLVAFTVAACSGESVTPLPTVPNPPVPPVPSGSTFLWGMVIEQSGICIPDARVRVVAGQRAGENLTQVTPCDAWGYGAGFVFNPVTAGVPMTLRISAPGYVDLDTTLTPSLGPQQAVLIAPARAKAP